MPTAPSPLFTINGTAGYESVAIPDGGAVVCTLADITGVSPVTWEISGTDEEHTAADFPFTISGSVNQTYTADAGARAALLHGTALTISCTVSGGTDPTGGTATMTQRRKIFVYTMSGRETLTVDEQNDDNILSSDTHGVIKPLNEAIRPWAQFTGPCIGGGTVDILSYQVPVDTTVVITGIVIASDDTNTDRAGYFYRGCWRATGGAAVLIGEQNDSFEDDAGWGVTGGAAGANAVITFTGDGVNATTVEASFNIQFHSTA